MSGVFEEYIASNLLEYTIKYKDYLSNNQRRRIQRRQIDFENIFDSQLNYIELTDRSIYLIKSITAEYCKTNNLYAEYRINPEIYQRMIYYLLCDMARHASLNESKITYLYIKRQLIENLKFYKNYNEMLR